MAETPGPERLDLGKLNYSIFWPEDFSDLAALVADFREQQGNCQHIVLTNDHILNIYQREIPQIFPGMPVLTVADGEKSKSLAVAEELLEELLSLSADRKTILYAFGGGVMGDLTGFIASVYMRGIRFVQIPSTLLSMVDSSVGGKTGVNLRGGKNMVGSFYQPSAVFICTPLLVTLPDREITCGLAEVLKSALIQNSQFFSYIEEQAGLIRQRDGQALKKLSFESVKIKAAIVEEDEKETGLRAVLNFGHTLAHAIESFYHYQLVNHGEAVSVGIAFAAWLSLKKGYLDPNSYQRIQSALQALALPEKLQNLPVKTLPTAAELLALMKKDKKNSSGQIHFIFLKGIGQSSLAEKVSDEEMLKFVEEFLQL